MKERESQRETEREAKSKASLCLKEGPNIVAKVRRDEASDFGIH